MPHHSKTRIFKHFVFFVLVSKVFLWNAQIHPFIHSLVNHLGGNFRTDRMCFVFPIQRSFESIHMEFYWNCVFNAFLFSCDKNNGIFRSFLSTHCIVSKKKFENRLWNLQTILWGQIFLICYQLATLCRYK